MKEPISIDKDKILAIVRDRKSQKIAVATIATATALIFSIVNLPVLKSHEEPAMKSMSIEAPHQVKSVLNDKSMMTDEDSKDLDKKEEPKKEETKKEDKKEDKKEETKKEDKKDESKKEEPKKEETKKEEPKKSESKSTSSSNSQSTARQNSSNTSQSQSSQSQSSEATAKSGSSVAATVPKLEIPKLKPRVSADEMNRNDKPSNWDGSKEVDEASVDDQWNDDDAIDEIDAR